MNKYEQLQKKMKHCLIFSRRCFSILELLNWDLIFFTTFTDDSTFDYTTEPLDDTVMYKVAHKIN